MMERRTFRAGSVSLLAAPFAAEGQLSGRVPRRSRAPRRVNANGTLDKKRSTLTEEIPIE
jgi:hypothetical protein